MDDKIDVSVFGVIETHIEALSFVDIRLLDHFIVGTEGAVSLAERGLI